MILANGSLTSYGVVGEKTGFRNIRVGDVVTVKFKVDGTKVSHVFSGAVVKHGDMYCVMGACGTELNLENYEFIDRVLPNELVTDAILTHLHNLKKVETKKLTISQVSRLLGYPVEII